ncbi:hypothetical protein Pan258_54340 [Symmachiella dynata]|nr:hypothetical protein Pan258_54340 [Symmachiella dynata]
MLFGSTISGITNRGGMAKAIVLLPTYAACGTGCIAIRVQQVQDTAV